MQKDLNVVFGNCYGEYRNRKYKTLFKNKYGSIASYYCENETLGAAMVESCKVSRYYPETALGCGEKILPVFISELCDNGDRTVVYEF